MGTLQWAIPYTTWGLSEISSWSTPPSRDGLPSRPDVNVNIGKRTLQFAEWLRVPNLFYGF